MDDSLAGGPRHRIVVLSRAKDYKTKSDDRNRVVRVTLLVAFVLCVLCCALPHVIGRSDVWQSFWPSVVGLSTLALGLWVVQLSTREQRKGALEFKEIRGLIEHENELLDHRLSWLMTSQAFLLAAYALRFAGTSAPGKVRPKPYVFQLMPWVAITLAVVIYISVSAAVGALLNLHESYGRESSDHVEVMSPRITMFAGLVTPVLLPVVLVCTWMLIVNN